MRSKTEAPIITLESFLPTGSYAPVMRYLQTYKVHLTITRERKTVLGDYRFAINGKNHRISVNGNLNPYAFLVTLLHELAHLVAFVKYGNHIDPHGAEWKQTYGEILQQFILLNVLPDDIKAEIKTMMKNPPATSCAEEGLSRVLRKYDKKPTNQVLVEEVPVNALFKTEDGRIFRRESQLRKRIKCVEIKTGRTYLFSPVYDVFIIPQ